MRKKLRLNINFKGNVVACAKSPIFCEGCKNKKNCERIEVYYYPFTNKAIKDCFKNDERHR